jgi:hypothetical protein
MDLLRSLLSLGQPAGHPLHRLPFLTDSIAALAAIQSYPGEAQQAIQQKYLWPKRMSARTQNAG